MGREEKRRRKRGKRRWKKIKMVKKNKVKKNQGVGRRRGRSRGRKKNTRVQVLLFAAGQLLNVLQNYSGLIEEHTRVLKAVAQKEELIATAYRYKNGGSRK